MSTALCVVNLLCLAHLATASAPFQLAFHAQSPKHHYIAKRHQAYARRANHFKVSVVRSSKGNDDDSATPNTRRSKGVNRKNKSSSKSNSKTARKQPKINSSSKLKGQHQQTNGNGECVTNQEDSSMYIQFSRVFQRHVVYRARNKVDINWDGIGEAALSNDKSNQVEVVESFEFLDQANAKYPCVRMLAPKDLPFPPPTCSLEFNDKVEGVSRAGRRRRKAAEADEYETTIAGMGLTSLCELEYKYDNIELVSGWKSSDLPSQPGFNSNTDELGYRYDQSRLAIQTLLKLVTTPASETNLPRHYFRLELRRFASRGLTSDMIRRNYNRVVQMLSGLLRMQQLDIEFVLANFPQLCLYNSDELEEIIKFLILPLPPEEYVSVYMVADKGIGGESVDWPRLSSKGFGAGLSVRQAAAAVRMMPELLALFYEDSSKPSIIYMHTNMQLSIDPPLLDETTNKISQILEGTPPEDTFFFAFMSSLNVSWGQLRILTSALKLWCNCAIDPTWELLQKDQVRSTFKSTRLHYLRQRLQVKPSDIHNMIKTHSRLSGYDACFNIRPTLNKLQTTFGLTSDELRKLVLRMPSVMGMGAQAIDEKLIFFQNEASMSTQQIREALLKQPSLIQYSIDNTLRPKLDFFLGELGIDMAYLGRIITSAPSLMGYSLSDNLRPKVCYLIKRCAIDQIQVGVLVATYPSLLLLSQKGKIEPTLSRLSEILKIDKAEDLGRVFVAAPRVLHHSIASLNEKFSMLTVALKSQEKAVAILRNNPSLMTWTVSLLKQRIRGYSDTDLFAKLQLSKKGRPKMIKDSTMNADYEDTVVIAADPSFESISLISPTMKIAAAKMGLSRTAVANAIQHAGSVEGNFFSCLKDLPINKDVKKQAPSDSQTVSMCVFVSGGVYPGDRSDVARGASRTGGVCMKVVNNDEMTENHDSTTESFRAAATRCFGVLVPHAGKDVLAVFPLINASRNRCDLFALWAALRVLETFVKTRRRKGDARAYDIKIFSDSNYALKLVSNRDRLLTLGSCFTHSQELLSKFNMNQSYVNIDILHPLSRSFSRLNGQDEPPQSRNRQVLGCTVQFLHSMNNIQDGSARDWPGGTAGFVKFLKMSATGAAKWQYNRE